MTILDKFNLSGKTALVTGARRGIGMAMAIALAEAGADIVATSATMEPDDSAVAREVKARGRIVVVAIYGEPPKVDLFRFFWRELQLNGARVYEPEDFELAIQLASTKRLPLAQLITDVLPLAGLEEAMQRMEKGGNCMKILVSCSE